MSAHFRTMAIWWRAFRFHFVPPSFLPAILGGITAWAVYGEFHAGYFLLTVIGVTSNHIALNMTDDYFDFRHSVDRAKDREKNPYSGGSGMLTSGFIKPERMREAFTIGYAITIIIGLYLTAMRGWAVLAFGTFGMACSYFYTAPPIQYGYRGFGELSQLVNFSFTIGLGSFFVQAQRLSLEALLVVLPLGFMMFSMITINEIPDEQDDMSAEKQTLVVLFGRKRAVLLYGCSMLLAYLTIIISPMLEKTSYIIYLSLITVPLSAKAFHILYRNYSDPLKMSPANLLTIRVHNLTGILLIAAYIIRGIISQRPMGHLWIAVLILAIMYIPVALTVFFDVLPLERKHI
jgi:1,4-dihydroxy-2-naphthoate octaprenyltransferase